MTLLKALLVGINSYPIKPLRGCVNEVLQIKNLLENRFGFSEANIRVLLNEDANLEAIQASLAWLAQEEVEAPNHTSRGSGSKKTEARDEASLRVFHFSGHGTYVVDLNGDEPDGRDECLVPFDFSTAGMLTDDALKELYDRFPRSGNLTLVMDCCHAGSVDKEAGRDVVTRFLPISLEEQESIDAAAHQFGQNQRQFIVEEISRLRDSGLSDNELNGEISRLVDQFQKQRFGDLRLRDGNVLLAACRPDQQAADALLSGDYHGAFTYCLVRTAEQARGTLPYNDLLQGTAHKMNTLGFTQIPQLECAVGHVQQPAFQPFL